MLANPDISPSASINRWILAILTFHFTLVHVPGVRHGPDGLSRRKRQPDDDSDDDEPDDEEEFEDWIDRVYGFLHMLNPIVPKRQQKPKPIAPIYLLRGVEADNYQPDYEEPTDPIDIVGRASEYQADPNDVISYDDFPRPAHAVRSELKLSQVRVWLETLVRPTDMEDREYSKFIRFAQRYFVKSGRLWRKDKHGKHKLVLEADHRLSIMGQAHDDLGHREVYATHAHLDIFSNVSGGL